MLLSTFVQDVGLLSHVKCRSSAEAAPAKRALPRGGLVANSGNS
jgi:hypothetical protein